MSFSPQSPDLMDHFPFGSPRPGQIAILEAFQRTLGVKKHMIFEAPTGIGKSPLAFTLASWAAANCAPSAVPSSRQRDENDEESERKIRGNVGAYILTTQKTLQDQYIQDFGKHGMTELRGVANYDCHFHGTDCAQGRQLDKALKASGKPVPECGGCPYVMSREGFIQSPISLTNFAYFLTVSSKTTLLPQRPLLILDEAHNTEMSILGNQSVDISINRTKELGIDNTLPRVEAGDMVGHTKAVTWCKDVFIPTLSEYLADQRRILASGGLDKKLAGRLAGKVEGYEQLRAKVKDFCGDETTAPRLDDWIVYTDDRHNLIIKPLNAAPYAKRLFDMGESVVFMSATILNARVFSDSLGLAPETCGFKSLDSEFPVENRLIHFRPVGSMSYSKKRATIPHLMKALGGILRENGTTKGIIHCQSFDLAQQIMDYFEGTPHENRFITHMPGVRNGREEAILRHVTSPEPTILLSPSMTEGLDLKGDLSRWQVIAKMPYASLADPFVKAKKNRDDRWYAWTTALTLAQATGRSVRSATDYASTYILDSDFETFMKYNGKMLPDWWKKSICYE